MSAVWDGEVGRRWVADGERYERMNAPFVVALRDAAAIRPGERVLDVGCGFGAGTLDAALVCGPAGLATGVDISGPMVEDAILRAERAGVANVSFRRTDAQVEPLGFEEFDVAISQFGVMFFGDPVVAFGNIRRSLRDDGRLAFVCWQEMGEQQRLMVPLLAALEHVPVPEYDTDDWSHAAFSLADAELVRRLLGAAGFADIAVRPVRAVQFQGIDVADTVNFLRGSEFGTAVFARADEVQADAGWAAVAAALKPFAAPSGVLLEGAAWLVTARCSDRRLPVGDDTLEPGHQVQPESADLEDAERHHGQSASKHDA